jgi:hypothetical protein
MPEPPQVVVICPTTPRHMKVQMKRIFGVTLKHSDVFKVDTSSPNQPDEVGPD